MTLNQYVRSESAFALVSMAAGDPDTEILLVEALADEDPYVRMAAMTSLGAIQGEAEAAIDDWRKYEIRPRRRM